MRLSADRALTPKARTVRVSAGINYTGHFTEVHYDRFNLEGRF